MMTNEEVKNAVKETYGKIAVEKTSCCGPNCGSETDDSQVASVMMNDRYTDVDEKIVEAANLGLGCGMPTAYADMQEGMTILDLGSGAGIDCFIASKKVGPEGKVFGIDMTDNMLKIAN